MSLIEFKNFPDTSTPINAENLNNNFNSIVESGNNENGSYIKFADGTLIQHKSGISFETTYKEIYFPISFLNGTYSAMVTGRYYHYIDVTYIISDFSKDKMRIWGIRTASGTSSDKNVVDYIAIGRWK